MSSTRSMKDLGLTTGRSSSRPTEVVSEPAMSHPGVAVRELLGVERRRRSDAQEQMTSCNSSRRPSADVIEIANATKSNKPGGDESRRGSQTADADGLEQLNIMMSDNKAMGKKAGPIEEDQWKEGDEVFSDNECLEDSPVLKPADMPRLVPPEKVADNKPHISLDDSEQKETLDCDESKDK